MVPKKWFVLKSVKKLAKVYAKTLYNNVGIKTGWFWWNDDVTFLTNKVWIVSNEDVFLGRFKNIGRRRWWRGQATRWFVRRSAVLLFRVGARVGGPEDHQQEIHDEYIFSKHVYKYKYSSIKISSRNKNHIWKGQRLAYVTVGSN